MHVNVVFPGTVLGRGDFSSPLFPICLFSFVFSASDQILLECVTFHSTYFLQQNYYMKEEVLETAGSLSSCAVRHSPCLMFSLSHPYIIQLTMGECNVGIVSVNST